MNDSKKRRLRDAGSTPGTLISDGCKIVGKLTGHGNFLVSGIFEGDCDVVGTVSLSKDGRWVGCIKAESVIVAGTVKGDIIASGKVEIGDTARVSGTISSDAIAVAEGAIVDGVMQTTGPDGPVSFVEKRGASSAPGQAAEDEEQDSAGIREAETEPA